MNNYWNPVDEYDGENPGSDKFVQMLKNSNIDEEIAEEVLDQIKSVSEDSEQSNVIFIFTDDNNYVVTGVHVPAESLDGETGPVLMRGRSDKSIIAAFSRDFIVECLDKADKRSSTTGLPSFADEVWISELENLAQMVRVKLAANPLKSWDEMLSGEGDR